jgi:hypothetical protein
MEWQSVAPDIYKRIFGESQTVFHSADFNALNQSRAEELRFLLYQAEHFTLGLVVGKKQGVWYSPFSSPFGGVEYHGKKDELSIARSLNELQGFLNEPIQITLPPDVYTGRFNLLETDHYVRSAWKLLYKDFNYHLDLTTDFESNLHRNARKNLNKALATDHRFVKSEDEPSMREVYSIIERNRKEKGYPLKMSFEQVVQTGSVIAMDFFRLEIEGKACASALVYRLNEQVAMIVYWGHLEAAAEFRPVNLLAHYLFNYYRSNGFEILDIGPSSELGVLNEGLAKFKLSLGCIQTEKATLRRERI